MTRRLFSLVLTVTPSPKLYNGDGPRSARLMYVHDLSDFMRRASAGLIGFSPVAIAMRAHLDFWAGSGKPKRWEAWLQDDAGLQTLRVLADPAHAPIPLPPPSPEAVELGRRMSRQWLIG